MGIFGDLSGQIADLHSTSGSYDTNSFSLASSGYAVIPVTSLAISKKLVKTTLFGQINFDSGNHASQAGSGVYAEIGVCIGDPANPTTDADTTILLGERLSYPASSGSATVPFQISILSWWEPDQVKIYSYSDPLFVSIYGMDNPSLAAITGVAKNWNANVFQFFPFGAFHYGMFTPDTTNSITIDTFTTSIV